MTDQQSTIGALRAEVEALRKRREWLPIESAPKDGTSIDVWAGNIRVCNVSWNEKAAEPYDDTGWCFDDWHTTYEAPCMTEVTPEPTHWMPLPEPPPPMTPPCHSDQTEPWAVHKELLLRFTDRRKALGL